MNKFLQSIFKGAITKAISTFLLEGIKRGIINKIQYDALSILAREYGFVVKPLKE